MNLPNRLTVARLFMVPLFVGLMVIDNWWGYLLACATFGIAALTDFLDGRIARARNLVTNFGKLMDPLADKVLVTSAFVMMMETTLLHVPGWTVVVILAREFLVTGARSVASSEGLVLAANIWGKTKAMLQMIYIGTFIGLAGIVASIQAYEIDVFPDAAAWLYNGSYYVMLVVTLVTVYSGIQFARTNWATLNLGGES